LKLACPTSGFTTPYCTNSCTQPGTKSPLNRFEEDGCTHKFGAKAYASEELIAEMGAAFLQQVEENTSAYIANWLAKLKNDKTLVVKAAGKAQ